MWRVYGTFYKFLWVYKWRMWLYLLVVAGFAAAENVQPYFYKLFVDNISGGNYQVLIRILLLFLLVRLTEIFFRVLTNTVGDWLILPTSRDIRMAVFKKVQDLDFAYHLSKSTGALISIFKRGDGSVFDLHHSMNIRLMDIGFGFVVTVILMSQISPYIGIFLLVSVLINLWLAKYLIKINIKTRAEFNDAEDDISGIIVDNLINFETVKLFAKETWEYQRLARHFKDWIVKLWNYSMSFRAIDVSVGVLGNAGLFIALLVGLNLVEAARMTAGDYVMTIGLLTMFYPKFFEMIYEFRNMAKHFVDLERYFGVLGLETEIKDPVKPIKKTSVNGEIEFKNLTFSYPEGKRGAIRNINLTIRQGQSVALVGSSGVGKTTLVKLLMRFYDPDKGEVLLDGINIKKFGKSQLRSFMGVVPQEPILFNDTIKYNIAYGAKRTTEAEIRAATKMANLNDFVESLPKKYETHVGERGIKLSGGQKQRLAIARMILSDPEIIIFDEATSQLDSESERKIQEAFWKAAQNKTTIIIAHRLSTIARADKIVVMERGTIAEIGSHRELLQRENSLYAKFWRLQTVN